MGRERNIFKGGREPAMLALKEAAGRESEMEIVLEEVPVRDGSECGEDRASSGC